MAGHSNDTGCSFPHRGFQVGPGVHNRTPGKGAERRAGIGKEKDVTKKYILAGLVLAGTVLSASAVLAQAAAPPAAPAAAPPPPPPGVQSMTPPPVTPAKDPLDPFAAITAGTMTPEQYRDQFVYVATVDPADPFHNLIARNWGMFEFGQWESASLDGKTFEEFWDTIQGMAGPSNILASPYPYTSAEEHWNAWKAAANKGAGGADAPATPQNWDGQWGNMPSAAPILRDYYNFASDAYKPLYLQSVQAEIEGRAYWPNSQCLPNGYGGFTSFNFSYADINGPLVHLNNMYVPAAMYEGRYIWVGKEFLNNGPSFMGDSIAFWDGDDLVVWTNNLFANSRGHFEFEYSDQLQIIERYRKVDDKIVLDVTRYDPVAYSGPMHSVMVLRKAPNYTQLAVEECNYGNNFYYNKDGLNAFLEPGQPRYSDRFNATPWRDIFNAGDAAKDAGTIPAAPSILDLASN